MHHYIVSTHIISDNCLNLLYTLLLSVQDAILFCSFYYEVFEKRPLKRKQGTTKGIELKQIEKLHKSLVIHLMRRKKYALGKRCLNTIK